MLVACCSSTFSCTPRHHQPTSARERMAPEGYFRSMKATGTFTDEVGTTSLFSAEDWHNARGQERPLTALDHS